MNQIETIIATIESYGFEAYLVGGSVRDMLLQLESQDLDLTTSARPDEIKQIFRSYKTLDTGIKHGVVTLVFQGRNYEITTFRTEGGYSDHRHPDEVRFSKTLEEDLSRRDFTINAMAWHPDKGFIDPYGGATDLEKNILRCVGDPKIRFEEDPLRILRGLRFTSRYGFEIERQTKKAMDRHKDLMFFVSKERIYAELKGILTGPHVEKILLEEADIFVSVIPELERLRADHVLWEHTAGVVSHAPDTVVLRLSALLHDISKPHVRKLENGVMIYPEHAKLADDMARAILLTLRSDNKTSYQVSQIIRYHSEAIEASETSVREWLHKLGPELFGALLDFKEADAYDRPERLAQVKLVQTAYVDVLFGKSAYTLDQLAINGRDLIKAGFPEGLTIGLILEKLLDEVIHEKVKNEKTALIDRAFQLR